MKTDASAGRCRAAGLGRARSVFAFLLAFAVLTGCSFRLPETQYFILTAAPAPHSGPVVQASIGFESLQPSRTYGQEQIAYRRSAHGVGFYPYFRWAVAPDLMLTEAFFGVLSGSARFKQVEMAPGRGGFDVVVSGRVIEFYEDEREDGKPARQATLKVEWHLRDGATDEPLKSLVTEERVPVAKPSADSIADGMSRAVERSAQHLSDAIAEAVSQRAKPKAPATRKAAGN